MKPRGVADSGLAGRRPLNGGRESDLARDCRPLVGDHDETVRIASGLKRVRQDVKLNAANTALRSKFRTVIKNVQKAVAAGDKAKAKQAYTTYLALQPQGSGAAQARAQLEKL